MAKLRKGDIVRHVSNPTPYIVHDISDRRYVIVSVKHINDSHVKSGEWIKE